MSRRDRVAAGGSKKAMSRKFLHGGVITALAVALVATGSGVTFALWTSSAEVTSTATTADLELTTAGFDTSLAKTFGNHDLGTIGSFTLTNTTVTSSAQPGNFSVALSSTGSAALAGKLGVAVWPVSNAADCAPAASTPGTAKTGTWASFTAPISGSLAPGDQASFCVRVTGTSRDDLAATSGSLQIQPSITATLTTGGWVDTATSQTTQKTAWIYPVHGPQANAWYQLKNGQTANCLDVNKGTANISEWTIDFACKTTTDASTYNQDWRFSPVGGGYFEVIPRHAQALRLDVPGNPQPIGAGVGTRVMAQDSARAVQQWQLQNRGGGVYQLVNRLSGLCLQPHETGDVPDLTEYAQMVCDGSTRQSFTLTSRGTESPAITAFACTNTPGPSNQNVVFSWQQPAVSSFDVQARMSGTNTYTSVGTVPVGATSFTMPAASSSWTDGIRNVRIMSGSTPLVSTTIWKGSSPERFRCSAPIANVDGLTCTSTSTGVVYAWAEPAVGTYDFQARQGSGTWYTVGTAPNGSTTAAFPVSALPSGLTNGVKPLRVVVSGTTTDIDAANSTVWKGQLTTGGTTTLQCAQPVAPLTSLTCQNSGNQNVTIGWGHPAVGPYDVDYQTIQGGWDNITTVAQGASSSTVSAGSNWANQDRILRVSFEGESATIVVSKTSRGNTHYLRCTSQQGDSDRSEPTVEQMSCTGNGSNYIMLGWSEVSPDLANTTFRASIDGIDVKSPTNPHWKFLQLYTDDSQPVTVGQFGAGVRTLLVEQKVGSGDWTAVGARAINIQPNGADGTNLSCG